MPQQAYDPTGAPGEDTAVISDFGTGIVASSDEASLTLAGIPGAVNVGFELTSAELWLTAPVDVAIDGSSIHSTGTAINRTDPDPSINVQVTCDELQPVPGG